MDTSHAAVGEHVPTSSPAFNVQENHCLSFDYKVWVSALGLENTPAPRLEVYIRISRHLFSGWKLWTSNGTGEGHAQISIRGQADSTYRISFVGVVGHPETTLISVANIQLREGSCYPFDCANEMCGIEGKNDRLSDCKLPKMRDNVVNK